METVSGANCAIVVGLILLGGAAIGLSRLWRVVASVAVLSAFVVLVTPEPSVLRASVMATLVLIAYAAGRPIQGLPVLACAVLGMLVTDPWLARNYGFVLSVLATGALLLMASPLAKRLARVMPLWLGAIIAVPLAAQLACQPVLVLLEPSVPAFGVIANILAAPAAPIATIVGLASCVLVPVFPALAQVGIAVAWLPASFIGATARFFSDLPLARVPWPGSVLGALSLAVITGLLIAVFLIPLSRRAQRWYVWAAAILIAAVVGVLSGGHLATQLGRPANWTFAACDIGQGDAVLVRSSSLTALIDTGPEPEALASCLDDLGVTKIDLLVLTHFDLDHVGGTSAVLGRVAEVWAGPPGERADTALLRELESSGARVQMAHAGDSGMLGELRWDVLWPPTQLGYLEPGNETSVTMHLYPAADCHTGCLSAMFLGDLGEQEQTRVLSLNPNRGQVDVVKVGHHGSADQSFALYSSLSARLGIISVGADNGYGHPAPRILSILSAAGTTPLRTDTGGLILLATGSPGTITVWSERPAVTGDD
ncbi:MAG TPA: ComEC/Rec2 family competence protein [Glaciihabitans sp.]|nr:ComEC/Rec2 family competence protein [Glaciihabitans sp.]